MSQFMPLTPSSAALIMPTQDLSRRPLPHAAAKKRSPWLARLITFGGSLILTLIAAQQMVDMLPLPGIDSGLGSIHSPILTLLVWLFLGLFVLTFGWVALSAMAALAGLVSRPNELLASPNTAISGKTVMIMPVYNEDPASAFGALAAMAEDLAHLGLEKHFEIFILSDSDRPELWSEELIAVQCLKEKLIDTMPVWYRKRDINTARKAGNVRDFITHWGCRYDYMIVLDADSLIAGEALASLVREMDADPDLGILQSLPRLFGGETLYARLQQFAGAVYGPVFARGLSAWQGQDGNYWGHNAIIRVRAFAESAGLPKMNGPKPFGGEIRSHDFVEAALVRRAGWSVRMVTNLPGSWEECPPTLLDASIRDRRWAQGNVQHLGVVSAKGLHWPSRAHMLMGVMSYVSSPLWLASVLMGLILSSWNAWSTNSGASGQILQQEHAGFDSEGMLALFLFTLALLLVPKIIGLINAMADKHSFLNQRRGSILASAILEQVFSIFYAPIVMFLHSGHLWEIFRGKDSGWAAQHRRGRAIPWSKLFKRHRVQTAAGLLAILSLSWLSSPLFYWLLPMTLGLVLSVPLSALSGSRLAGRLLAKNGVLNTPEETSVPHIMNRRRILIDSLCEEIRIRTQAQAALDALPEVLKDTAA